GIVRQLAVAVIVGVLRPDHLAAQRKLQLADILRTEARVERRRKLPAPDAQFVLLLRPAFPFHSAPPGPLQRSRAALRWKGVYGSSVSWPLLRTIHLPWRRSLSSHGVG